MYYKAVPIQKIRIWANVQSHSLMQASLRIFGKNICLLDLVSLFQAIWWLLS